MDDFRYTDWFAGYNYADHKDNFEELKRLKQEELAHYEKISEMERKLHRWKNWRPCNHNIKASEAIPKKIIKDASIISLENETSDLMISSAQLLITFSDGSRLLLYDAKKDLHDDKWMCTSDIRDYDFTKVIGARLLNITTTTEGYEDSNFFKGMKIGNHDDLAFINLQTDHGDISHRGPYSI